MISTTNLREIVNGSFLPKYNGRKVSVIGFVLKMEPSGTAFELRTVDDHIIKIMLKRPINDPLTDYVEVCGVAQGKSVLADEVNTFEKNVDFDSVSHNKLCSYLNTVSDVWKTSV